MGPESSAMHELKRPQASDNALPKVWDPLSVPVHLSPRSLRAGREYQGIAEEKLARQQARQVSQAQVPSPSETGLSRSKQRALRWTVGLSALAALGSLIIALLRGVGLG